ncbi:MAG TPA: N-glycosylase/DNA lyase [Candidatus Korarchaeota archaeon]|nr:N-glycosylase/DNA lyase [Candidatus Korarchaeota archaeon]
MGLEELLARIEELKRSEVANLIKKRMEEFEHIGRGSNEELFKELSFCLLTANYSAEGGIRIQREIGDGFITLSLDELARELRRLGHRFPKARAEYIVEARRFLPRLREILSSFDDEKALREWLARNIKGLGFKEASHFLRNIGFENIAIVDFHIVDLLVRYGLIERSRSITKRRYLEIEGILEKIADRANLTLAELDLYLWYIETGKVLK